MEPQVSFSQLITRGCGLDVHKNLIVASVSGEGIEEQTREFSAFTEDLEELRDWLNSLSVTHVAMESTSVYWKPVFNVLEEDFEIILVNARHIKNVPGHKTDKKDSQWIAKLLLGGLLKGSFIPPRPIRELRDLFRYRKKLTGQMVGEKNRLQKILEDANIKLASVASDIFGASGMAIIEAIVDGQTDAEALQQLAHGSLRKKEELKEALKGHVTAHHRFMLKTFLKSIAQIQAIMDDIDLQIEEVLKDYQTEMELLQTIPGVGRQTAGVMIAEMGADMQQFPSEHHLASWAGVCPGNNESAGKKKSARITQGNKMLKTALVEAAWVASCRKKDNYLKIKYASLVGRRGKKRALIAVAHKIIVAAYHILKNKEPYQEYDYEAFMQKRKQKQIEHYQNKLRELQSA